MEELKLKLAQHKVDYLSLFKSIDKTHRGVANAQEFYEYYRSIGGTLQISPKEF